MKNLQFFIIFISLFLLTNCQDLDREALPCPVIESISPNSGGFNTEVALDVSNLTHTDMDFYEVNINGLNLPIMDFNQSENSLKIVIPKEASTGDIQINYRASTGFQTPCESQVSLASFEYQPRVINARTLAIASDCEFLCVPNGIDVDDSGQVFVAEKDKNRVLKIDPVSGTVENYVGLGLPGCLDNEEDSRLTDPSGLAIAANSIFIAEQGSFLIRRISISAGRDVVQIAGECGISGDFSNQQFTLPQGMEMLSDGRILIADSEAKRIIALTPISGSPNSYSFNVFAGSDSFGSGCMIEDNEKNSAVFCSPYDITVDESTGSPVIYITEKEATVIRKITEDGTVTTLTLDNTDGQLQNPTGITNDGKGNLYVADSDNGLVFRINLKTNKIYTLSEINDLVKPEGIAFYAPDNLLYVTDRSERKIVQIEIE